FTLLRLGPNPPAATSIAEAAARHDAPLSVVALTEPEVLAAYERRLVLVRPDGHVAWRSDDEPANADALIDAVRGEPHHRHSRASRNGEPGMTNVMQPGTTK